MGTAAIMVQGTGSGVGKSLIVAALCRAFRRQGLLVRPFKPQNMSNNAAVTPDGGEIGRAQALQARAAGVVPSVHMNPVLLKPEGDLRSQLIVQGRVVGQVVASHYREARAGLLPRVLESFAICADGADLVVVEGAGSPAETNLRSNDIANMGFARAADVRVLLIGDIDRGGVIASLVGTHAVLAPADRAMIRGFLINRLRGDPALFNEGMETISHLTGWPSLGLLPWQAAAWRLPAEDAASTPPSRPRDGGRQPDRLVIAVPWLPRVANFDDLDPLRAEPGVDLRLLEAGAPIPAEARLVLLVGSKATRADLAALIGYGWDSDIKAHVRRGGRVAGICGGYQMLGRRIEDPSGIEGLAGGSDGLGLLDVQTILDRHKITRPVRGRAVDDGSAFSGYEIHVGQTLGPDTLRPLFCCEDGRQEGARRSDDRVRGTYIHGLLANDQQRSAFLSWAGGCSAGMHYEAGVESALDELADAVGRCVDLPRILGIARDC